MVISASHLALDLLSVGLAIRGWSIDILFTFYAVNGRLKLNKVTKIDLIILKIIMYFVVLSNIHSL